MKKCFCCIVHRVFILFLVENTLITCDCRVCLIDEFKVEAINNKDIGIHAF